MIWQAGRASVFKKKFDRGSSKDVFRQEASQVSVIGSQGTRKGNIRQAGRLSTCAKVSYHFYDAPPLIFQRLTMSEMVKNY